MSGDFGYRTKQAGGAMPVITEAMLHHTRRPVQRMGQLGS